MVVLRNGGSLHSGRTDGFVLMIFLALLLKNIDKQLLGLFKPFLDAEFGWSDTAFGVVAGLSQLVGAVSLPVAGWLVDTLPLRRVLGSAVAVWSASTLAQAAASGFWSMMGARVALSAAEAVGTPSALFAVSAYRTAEQRPRAVALINMAGSLAAIIAPVLVTVMATRWGWRSAAILAAAMGWIWLFAWCRIRFPKRVAFDVEIAQTPGRLNSFPAAALIAAKAMTDQLWWIMLFWLPDFLGSLGAEPGSGWGVAIASCYALAALGSIAAGRLLHWTSAAYAAGLAVCLMLPFVSDPHDVFWSAVAIGSVLFAHQIVSSRVFLAICDDRFAGETGRLAGRAAFAGHLVAFVSLTAVGAGIEAGMSYRAIFDALALLYAAGILALYLGTTKLPR